MVSSRPISRLSSREQIARMQLIRTDSVGPISFRQILSRFGSAEAALRDLPHMARLGGRKKPLVIPAAALIEAELKALEKMGGTALHLGDDAYPAPLAFLEDAPPVLFVKGHIGLLKKNLIALVGSRNASAAGLRMAEKLASDLAQAGLGTVSGLARGIDTLVHRASLDGGTVACLAGGLDIIYPPENEGLYEQIGATGLLVSEMPLSTKPQARHFPRRNRLISGMSLGLVVIEAAEKSGSLISARYALDQGRLLFAVPGSPLDPRSKGTNQLLRDGAYLVRGVDDILSELEAMQRLIVREKDDELPLFAPSLLPKKSMDLSVSEADCAYILNYLSPSPVFIDDLIRLSERDAGQVQAILLILELAGKAIRYSGGRVARLDDFEDEHDKHLS